MTSSFREIGKSRKCWRGTQYMIPIYATSACGLFWAEDNQYPAG